MFRPRLDEHGTSTGGDGSAELHQTGPECVFLYTKGLVPHSDYYSTATPLFSDSLNGNSLQASSFNIFFLSGTGEFSALPWQAVVTPALQKCLPHRALNLPAITLLGPGYTNAVVGGGGVGRQARVSQFNRQVHRCRRGYHPYLTRKVKTRADSNPEMMNLSLWPHPNKSTEC